MKINYICDQFVKGRPIKGCHLSVDNYGNKTTLSYRYNGNNDSLIAEIVDRKENGDFTLILYPRATSWGKTSHCNRILGVLMAFGEDYRSRRFFCYVHYYIKVIDRKLGIDYQLQERPMKFNYTNGKLVIDYADLESHATPVEERKQVPDPGDNSNIKNELDRLTTILSTV